MIIDMRDQPHGGKIKWRKKRTKKKGILIHHSAVHGGFGTHRSVRNKYEGRCNNVMKWGSEENYVKAMALGHRYRGEPEHLNKGGCVPYHAIWNEHVGVTYYNLDFDLHSFHGNTANRDFLGWCWDENSKKVGDNFDMSGAQDSLRQFVIDARADGHPIEEFTCHCAWTNKPNDPGRGFIDLVVEPIAMEMQIKIDWDFVAMTKGGKRVRGAKSMGEVMEY